MFVLAESRHKINIKTRKINSKIKILNPNAIKNNQSKWQQEQKKK